VFTALLVFYLSTSHVLIESSSSRRVCDQPTQKWVKFTTVYIVNVEFQNFLTLFPLFPCSIRIFHMSMPTTLFNYYYYYLLHPFNGLFSRRTWASRHKKGKTSLDLNETRDDGVLECCGISWTICKQSAPRCRQITTPPPRHSSFLQAECSS